MEKDLSDAFEGCMSVNFSQLDVNMHEARLAKGKPVPKSNHAPVDREGDLHGQIIEYCESKGWLYRHDRMDKPTTQIGFPDFVIFQPMQKTTFIECKARGKKATIEQLSVLAHAKKLGYKTGVVDSMDGFLELINL